MGHSSTGADKPGKTEITLTSEELNLPVPGIALIFAGVPDVNGTTVTWSTDTPLNNVFYQGQRILRVKGSFVTSLSSVPDTVGQSCNSDNRLFRALIQATSTTPTLIVTLDISGLSESDSRVNVAIQFQATCGEALPPSYFGLSLQANHWERDGCGHSFQLVTPPSTNDNPVKPLVFTAQIENSQLVGTLTSTQYHWSVIGPATLVAPADQRQVQVTLNDHGTVTLTCDVTVVTDLNSGGAAIGTVDFAVITPTELLQYQAICELRRRLTALPNLVVPGSGGGFRIGRIHVVDPLFDPPKDAPAFNRIVARPFDAFELSQLRGAAEHIARTANRVLEHTNGVIAERKQDLRPGRNTRTGIRPK